MAIMTSAATGCHLFSIYSVPDTTLSTLQPFQTSQRLSEASIVIFSGTDEGTEDETGQTNGSLNEVVGRVRSSLIFSRATEHHKLPAPSPMRGICFPLQGINMWLLTKQVSMAV